MVHLAYMLPQSANRFSFVYIDVQYIFRISDVLVFLNLLPSVCFFLQLSIRGIRIRTQKILDLGGRKSF